MPEQLKVRAIASLAEIGADTWDVVCQASGNSCLNSHAFLSAFETSKSVCPETGWQPHHLLLESVTEDRSELIAAIPLYVKSHSYGEFIFDWAWADAYERNGLQYYPKWLGGVPFTPVTTSRLLAAPSDKSVAAAAVMQWVKANELSSLHMLYTNASDQQALETAGCLTRSHTQFHWQNPGWKDFDDYLQSLTQPKRKKIRAERRKVKEAGITTVTKTGAEITEADWDFFYRCYAQTYAMRGNAPYLTRQFFSEIDNACAVLVLASEGTERIAASLLWLDRPIDPQTSMASTKLYGRYWGSLAYVDCLHFEVAYYAPIEWAIEHGISVIEGGAQGEHKLARGFVPVQTQSAHWLAHTGFAQAIEQYLSREQQGVQAYTSGLRSPFRVDPHD